MEDQQIGQTSRRRALQLGGLAGAMAAAGPLLASGSRASAATLAGARGISPDWSHEIAEIEKIMRAKGTVSNGVLNIQVNRYDIGIAHKDGVPIKAAFELNGNFCFQSLGNGNVMLNGDFGFKPEELNPAVHALISHGLVWQAMHQHLFNLNPMLFFLHFRGRGSARSVAEGCKAILDATSTPLPQAPPKNPTTPLDTKRLAKIIGAPATVGGAGVVGFELAQREPVILDGVKINPYLNIYTPVDFQPLGGDRAVGVPDFGMLAGQVDDVARTMQSQGWQLDCLYNQETDEHPQLYFSHQFKVGNAYQLAMEIRKGLEKTSVVIH